VNPHGFSGVRGGGRGPAEISLSILSFLIELKRSWSDGARPPTSKLNDWCCWSMEVPKHTSLFLQCIIDLSRYFCSELGEIGRLCTPPESMRYIWAFTATGRKHDARLLFSQGFCSLHGHVQARQDPPAPKFPKKVEIGCALLTQKWDLSGRKPGICSCRASSLSVGIYDPIEFCLLEKFLRTGAWSYTSKSCQELARKQLYLNHKTTVLDHESTTLNHETTKRNHEPTILNHETTTLNHEQLYLTPKQLYSTTKNRSAGPPPFLWASTSPSRSTSSKSSPSSGARQRTS
jgi:hypothetical protein